MTFLGVAFACGSLVFGLVVIRSSLRCMIARQYLCQVAGLGCGITTLLLTLADGFHGYSLYVWTYGVFCGGHYFMVRVYTYEQVTIKLAERCNGFVMMAQVLPTLFGSSVACR